MRDPNYETDVSEGFQGLESSYNYRGGFEGFFLYYFI